MLYFIQYLMVVSVPIILGYGWAGGTAFAIAILLVIGEVYLLPRMYLPPRSYEEKAAHYEGIIRVTLCLNRIIPLNKLIKRLITGPKKHGVSVTISRENAASILDLHNLLYYGYRQ